MKRVLICGDRNWGDLPDAWEPLDALINAFEPDTEIVHGDARGADKMAGYIARKRNLRVYAVPAQWKQYGKAAGPRRNHEMLDMDPDVIYAFHPNISESKGTRHMCQIAYEAGLTVHIFDGETFTTWSKNDEEESDE